MSKRFASTCFIVLASILIVCFLFVVVLFMLPGVSLFGIKYIGHNTHAGSTGKVIMSERVDTNGETIGVFSGIIVNCYEVPINVIFSEGYTYYLEYYDNYNGITSSKITDPSIYFEKDDSGNIIINISEYHTFLYESGISERYLNLYMPVQELAQQSKYTLNLTINSTLSPVTFKMENSGYVTPCTFSELTINTNGKINVEYNVKATTYSLTTSNSIEVNEDLETTISATNYNLTSTSGKITVYTDVAGDLNCSTKLGRIMILSCRNFTASTTFGDVGYSGTDDGAVTVRGVVDITTRAGNVTLGDVKGESRLNSISTSSGNITINTICDGEASTKRGQVNITSVRNFTITSTTGKITIQEVKTQLEAHSTRGKITLGGEKMLVNNASVYSTFGKVTLLSASGNVYIETISADVSFSNSDSDNIYINCGGKLSATGLMGTVDIYVGKAVENMEFTSVDTGNVEITLGSDCSEAYIYISASDLKEVSYYIEGSVIEIQEYINAEWQQDGGSNSDVYSSPTSLSPYSFTLKSENARIILRFTLSS